MMRPIISAFAALLTLVALATEPKEERGVYFATHFGNWYERASDDEIVDYIKELAWWGCNEVSAWFDMHDFDGMQDPRANKRLERIKLIFRTAQQLGLERDLLFLANESFASSPIELRADWRPGKNGYTAELLGHYHVEICPSKTGGTELIMKYRGEVLDAFADTPPTKVTIFPYDQGGCTCDGCAPWGARGYLKLAKALSEMVRTRFPNVTINLSTWRFDAFGNLGEWNAVLSNADMIKSMADRLYVEAGDLAKMDKNPFMPYFSMSEISMFAMLPWGGFGANPQPNRLANEIAAHPNALGLRPYSEGIFEDVNKAIVLAIMSGKASNADDALSLYAKRYFGEGFEREFIEAMKLLEANLDHNAVIVTDYGTYDSYYFDRVDFSKTWSLELRTPHLDLDRARHADELMRSIEARLIAEVAKSWRWRILKIRSEVDLLLAEKKNNEALNGLFKELKVIYKTDEGTIDCLVPPILSAR